MKSSAIIKIIIWSCVALFFTAMLTCIVVFDNFGDLKNSFTFHIGSSEKYAKTKRITEIDASSIDSLNINWTYGSVYLIPYDGNKIIITEKATGGIYKNELLKINQDNNVLNLEQKSDFSFFNIFSFGIRSVVREIKIPDKEYKEIYVHYTSGRLEMSNVKTDIFNCRMTSGSTNAEKAAINSLITNITSGNINIEGSIKKIDIKETSGITSVASAIVPSKLNVNITSGTATISIPDNDGFIVGKDITSGSFSSGFKLDRFGRYKNGSREYSVKITSGSVHLNKY